MQQADFQKFKSIMAGLGRVYSADTDGVILDAYWLALRDWSLPEFEQAASHLLANCQFMPKPSDFTAVRKASQETAGEAWCAVLDVTRRMSRHESVSISPRIDRVVRAMGGYGVLSMMETDALQFHAKRFAALWDELGEAEESRIALPSSAKRLDGPQKLFAVSQ